MLNVICRGPFCLCLILIDTRPQSTHTERVSKGWLNTWSKNTPFYQLKKSQTKLDGYFFNHRSSTSQNSVLWNILESLCFFTMEGILRCCIFVVLHGETFSTRRMFSFPTSNAGHFVPQPWSPSGKASSGVGRWWIKQDWDHYQPIKREQQDDVGGYSPETINYHHHLQSLRKISNP